VDELMTPWPEPELDPAAAHSKAAELRGGAEYAELHTAQRLLQDRLAGARLPGPLAKEITERLHELTEQLAGYQVPEPDRVDGWRPDLPGRGLSLLPPFVIDEEDERSLSGRVTFTRYYLGGNGAAHGGSQPLLFDDLFGRVANHHQDGVARTASLTVNYRRVTPLDVELRFAASLDRIEGRKRLVSGRLFDQFGAVLSDAEGLFLRLLPGQA
jgi:acyl-coenzyme A thioesterase PaaI-like protein